ncbi:hypothetical protein ACTQ3T_10995 [Segatella copri]|uniref:hypothetical protein n=1 Tax=Segatella copri TaxID=165179 RepID=UPI003F9A04E5
MKKGKDKCEILKMIRKYVAKKYGLDYEPSECTHEGSCMGSCLKCDGRFMLFRSSLKRRVLTPLLLTRLFRNWLRSLPIRV